MRGPRGAVEPHARERVAIPQRDEEEGHAGRPAGRRQGGAGERLDRQPQQPRHDLRRRHAANARGQPRAGEHGAHAARAARKPHGHRPDALAEHDLRRAVARPATLVPAKAGMRRRGERAHRLEHERRADRRMSCERQLRSRREDAHRAGDPGLGGRKDEGRLAEVQLARDRLHRLVRELAHAREHGQRIAAERPVGEHVGEDEVERSGHRASCVGQHGATDSGRRILILARRLRLRRMADLPGSLCSDAIGFAFAFQLRDVIAVQDAAEACLSHARRRRQKTDSDPVSVRPPVLLSVSNVGFHTSLVPSTLRRAEQIFSLRILDDLQHTLTEELIE
jgi:hypothetical protein